MHDTIRPGLQRSNDTLILFKSSAVYYKGQYDHLGVWPQTKIKFPGAKLAEDSNTLYGWIRLCRVYGNIILDDIACTEPFTER
ncbi:MAG: hypothetical protein JW801_17625 [Bacteroidales bacterium]|nr:hypothetical protein [Bacteroidales bacterium]